MGKEKFFTCYNPCKNVDYSCAGTKVVDVDKISGEKVVLSGRRYTYKQEWDEQGRRHLVVSGTEDVYNYIQSFKDDTDIYKILKRLNGDISKLDSNKGFYADVSSIPKDFYEFHNKVEQGHQIFAGLPTDLKQKFGNNVNEFMNSIFNKDFELRYTDYLKEKFPKKFSQDSVVSDSVVSDDKGGVKNE